MGAPGCSLSKYAPNSIDLFVWNRHADAARAHKSQHAVDSVHLCSIVGCQSAADKNVTAKKRNLDLLLAVAPAVHFLHGRKERLHSLLPQPMLDDPFVTSARVERVPTQV